MKYLKNPKIRVWVIILASILILYIAESVVIGVQINKILNSSYDNLGENNPYPEMVSDEIYRNMCYRRVHLSVVKEGQEYTESNVRFPVFALHWITGGKAFYNYSHTVSTISGEGISGSLRITCTVTFKMDGLTPVITDFYEPP